MNEADKFQELFNYLHQELGAIALTSQMAEIVEIVERIDWRRPYETHPDDCAHPSDCRYTKTLGGSCTCETTVIACRLCGAHLTKPETDC